MNQPSVSVRDAGATFVEAAEAARQAATLAASGQTWPESAARIERDVAAALKIYRTRATAWNAAVRQTLGAKAEASGLLVDENAAPGTAVATDLSWVIPEIDRRIDRLNGVLATSDFVPPYALADRAKYARMIEALPSAPDYERVGIRQLSASSAWTTGPGNIPFGTST